MIYFGFVGKFEYFSLLSHILIRALIFCFLGAKGLAQLSLVLFFIVCFPQPKDNVHILFTSYTYLIQFSPWGGTLALVGKIEIYYIIMMAGGSGACL